MKKLACYELSKCLPFRNIAEFRFQVAAILKTKMAAKNWTYQLASIKIPVQDDLNYLCAKIRNFIQKCTLHLTTPIFYDPHTYPYSVCGKHYFYIGTLDILIIILKPIPQFYLN